MDKVILANALCGMQYAKCILATVLCGMQDLKCRIATVLCCIEYDVFIMVLCGIGYSFMW